MKFVTGFGGGIAETEDVCGALVSAIIIIGALYGRTDLTEDQSTNWRLSAEYRRRFLEALSSTNCGAIKAFQAEHWQHESCSRTVATAIGLLLDLLAEEDPSMLEEYGT